MTSQPRGIRGLVETVRPWGRRAVQLLAVWLGLVVMTAVLGLTPSVVQLGGILAAGAALLWYLMDHTVPNHMSTWPLTDVTELTTHLGGDFRVTQLAQRLEAADLHREGRAELTKRLHHQLSAIIDERLFAKHGITIEEEPRWAEGVMPPELWDFATGLPDPALYSPANLDEILRRIEQW
jgi:hypothetical protein